MSRTPGLTPPPLSTFPLVPCAGRRKIAQYRELAPRALPLTTHTHRVASQPQPHRQSLRRSQDIKVDFASFPNNLVQLLEKCTSHEDSRYLLELETAEISGAAGAALAALNVVEVNDFKNLVHLSLRWVRARCVARVKRTDSAAFLKGGRGTLSTNDAGRSLQPGRCSSGLTAVLSHFKCAGLCRATMHPSRSISPRASRR